MGESTNRDSEYMRAALELAERGWGRVQPNPMVGALVVRDNAIVGRGYHAEYGDAHAEVAALRDAGSAASGATLYVTLEPCTHHGKTPPCTDAVADAGVRRVVFAVPDPGTEAGGGADVLRARGLEVLGGVEEMEARRQNAIFFHAARARAPFVALKYALSLDARLSGERNLPSRVTGAASRTMVQRIRAGYGAILIGSGTAQADDPLLTVRGEIVPRAPPIRIVLDRRARLSPESRLALTTSDAPSWIFCAEDADADRVGALEDAGVRAFPVPSTADGVDVAAVFERLHDEGVASVLCEGGGQVGSALLAEDRVERQYLFIAPRLYGEPGAPAFHGAFPDELRDGWRLDDVEACGDDALLVVNRIRDRRERGANG